MSKGEGLIMFFHLGISVPFQKGYCSNKYTNSNQNRATVSPYPRIRFENAKLKTPEGCALITRYI